MPEHERVMAPAKTVTVRRSTIVMVIGFVSLGLLALGAIGQALGFAREARLANEALEECRTARINVNHLATECHDARITAEAEAKQIRELFRIAQDAKQIAGVGPTKGGRQ